MLANRAVAMELRERERERDGERERERGPWLWPSARITRKTILQCSALIIILTHMAD